MSEEPTETGQSKIGGKPDLPEDITWPLEEEEEQEGPLAFVCQINLSEVHKHDVAKKLPKEGVLWVFSIADSDRAYSYEIDDDTTTILFQENPTTLNVNCSLDLIFS